MIETNDKANVKTLQEFACLMDDKSINEDVKLTNAYLLIAGLVGYAQTIASLADLNGTYLDGLLHDSAIACRNAANMKFELLDSMK